MEEGIHGYIDAFSEAGLKYRDDLIIEVNDNLLHNNPDQGEIERMAALMDRAGNFSAFIALNDRLLKSGISILRAGKKKIGTDIEIAAHGDIASVYPPYTLKIQIGRASCRERV